MKLTQKHRENLLEMMGWLVVKYSILDARFNGNKWETKILELIALGKKNGEMNYSFFHKKTIDALFAKGLIKRVQVPKTFRKRTFFRTTNVLETYTLTADGLNWAKYQQALNYVKQRTESIDHLQRQLKGNIVSKGMWEKKLKERKRTVFPSTDEQLSKFL